MENWILPLTLLPGVGLIIMSTTNWSLGLTSEINQLLEQHEEDMHLLELKVKQLGLINWGLVVLYFCAATLTITALISGISEQTHAMLTNDLFLGLLIFSILSLIVALVILIIFSFRAVRIKQGQFSRKVSESPSAL